MKKVVFAVISIVCVAVAAQAQSPRVEVALTSGALNGNKKTGQIDRRKSTQWADSLTRKVMQQVDRAAQKSSVKKAPAKKAKPTANTQKAGIGAWIKAALLGGKYPGESDQAYHDRLMAQSQPASLPFK